VRVTLPDICQRPPSLVLGLVLGVEARGFPTAGWMSSYETPPDIERMPGKGRELHGASRSLVFSACRSCRYRMSLASRRETPRCLESRPHRHRMWCSTFSSTGAAVSHRSRPMPSNISSSVVAAERSNARISRIAFRAA
jgi:hypothetical protein